MFYSKYSDYSPEQIKTEDYEKLCEQLLSLAKDKNIKEKMQAVLYEGGFDDFSVNTGLTKNNQFIERKKRIGYAYLLATNPETFDILTKNDINLFHGTNANTLPNILKYGMQSVDEQSSKGIVSSTGEEWSRIGGKRDFISFTDDIDTALDYSSITPLKDTSTQESFGVLIGMSSNSLSQLKTCRVHSDLPELGILNNIPLEQIKTIAVPEDKVEFVRKIVGNNQIIVTPISIDEKFYYIDSESGEISFDFEKIKQLAEEKKQTTRTTFNSNEIEEISKTRRISRIQSIYGKIKETIRNRGKENGRDTRD